MGFHVIYTWDKNWQANTADPVKDSDCRLLHRKSIDQALLVKQLNSVLCGNYGKTPAMNISTAIASCRRQGSRSTNGCYYCRAGISVNISDLTSVHLRISVSFHRDLMLYIILYQGERERKKNLNKMWMEVEMFYRLNEMSKNNYPHSYTTEIALICINA